MSDRVEHRIKVRVAGYEPSPIVFGYDPADPLAVVIGDVVGGTFRFGRQLLSDGISFPAGNLAHGDVMVQPVGDEILIDLYGLDPFGCWATARMSVIADDLAAFLDATFELIPEGTETFDVDALVTGLLGGVR